jgi:type I restriction enzyme M protein
MNRKQPKVFDSKHLKTEADVENFFVVPLLRKLGFSTAQIKGKHSLSALSVRSVKGTGKQNYKPDFAIVIKAKVRLIIEAKGSHESLDKHIQQPREYSAILNGEKENDKPVKYFLLTNGNLTRLFKHDLNDPILEMTGDEFSEGNRKYEHLKSYLNEDRLIEDQSQKTQQKFKLRKAPLQEVNTAFSWCHQHIYRSDNISQGAAFTEFVKLIALKLSSDRDIREKYPSMMTEDEINVPTDDVKFSLHWLNERTGDTPNPMDTIWFQKFIKDMELEIQQRKRKRIFASGDHINLSPETIQGVVRKLEDIFLFGIDADLNGRLFETFLNATMRGKDLGQYFTPRSVVKLGVALAQLNVDPADLKGKSIKTDRVIDACCGTGGFLIDALADMWHRVDENSSLNNSEKSELKKQIANHHIFGIDIGRDPNLSRIARLNMYLHGDGGSSIFNTDSLDKKLPDLSHDLPDVIDEKTELRNIYKEKDGFFDVALTNPPFAKAYKAEGKSEKDDSTITRILNQYELTVWPDGKKKNSLKSSLMFYERYFDLLVPGGRLVSVIDDGLLSGSDNLWFRNYLREKFIVRAVVSLPGDAFQRSKARVKTSIIVLTKKRNEDETQPDVFMYPCRFVGIDDPSRQRVLPMDEKMRQNAKGEIREVLAEYNKYTAGKGNKQYSVPSHKVQHRLDVKHCLMSLGASLPVWKKKGLSTINLSQLVEPKNFLDIDKILSAHYEGTVQYLRVRYDGGADIGEEVDPADTTYAMMFRVHNGDIVISNIAATYGSVAVVDEVTDGCVVTNEYTVLSAKDGHDPLTIWTLMRSKEVRADMLLAATGANRTRVKWENISEINIPYPKIEEAKKFANSLRKFDEQEKQLRQKRQAEIDAFSQSLELNGAYAEKILQAFKPPK